MAEKIYGHCRACHTDCPAWYTVEDGKIIAMDPVPVEYGGTGTLCGRGIGALQLLNSPTRVKYPMKRVGKRGEGKWERISWDQAVDEIAHKIVDMSDEYGAETFVLPGRTGRQDMGWIAHRIARTIGTPNNYYGAIQVCLLPQMQTSVNFGSMTNQAYGFDPRTKLIVGVGQEASYSEPVFHSAQAQTEKLGVRNIRLDPVCGPQSLRAEEWLPVRPGTDLAYFMGLIKYLIETDTFEHEFIKQWTNAPFLVRSDTGALAVEANILEGGSKDRYLFWDAASKSIKYWDSANIQWEGGESGLAHFNECVERFNKNIGSTELSPATMPEGMDPELFGSYDIKLTDGTTVQAKPAFQLLAETVKEMTPAKVADICGIDADQVERTYKTISVTRPVDFYEGLQYMATNASQYFNAVNICKMLCGSVDTTANNTFSQCWPVSPQPFPGEFEISYCDGLSDEQKRKRLGYNEHKIGCGYAWEEWSKWLPQRFENADASLNFPDVGCVLKAAEEGDPYEVHGIIAISSNWLMHDPSTARWMRLLEDESKIQLHVVTEMVMTPTAEMADYVLPAQSWMERNYLEFSVTGNGDKKLAFNRCVDPIGEARHDYDFGAALAHKLEEIRPGYNSNQLLNPEGTLYWGGQYGELWENDTIDEERDRWCREFAGVSWDACLEAHMVPLESTPGAQWERYRVSGKFNTDTGKANLFSTLHQKAGYPPLPVYSEPAESPISQPEKAKEYPLVLTTGKRQAGFFHSEFRQIPYIRECNPTPEVFINPETAEKYGVKHGDWVWVESAPDHGRAPYNRIMGRVSFRFMVRPDLVSYSQHAWWRPEKRADDSMHGGLEFNAEALLEADNSSPETGTPGLRSQLCKIYKCSDEDIEKYQPMITREQLEALMPVEER